MEDVMLGVELQDGREIGGDYCFRGSQILIDLGGNDRSHLSRVEIRDNANIEKCQVPRQLVVGLLAQ